MSVNTHPVAKESEAVKGMRPHWDLVTALLGGTTEMRTAGTIYLPKWSKESDAAYAVRLSTSTLYPAYSHTIDVMTGKPFSREITFEDELEEARKPLVDNIDRAGRNLTQFAADVFQSALGYGMSHIVVDYPVNKGERTIQQEREAGLRPYFVHVKPTQLIGWRATEDGTLMQVRFYEAATVDDGDFGQKTIKQIRVLSPTKWQVWRRVEGSPTTSDWALFDEGVLTLGETPFVTVYGRRTGFMTSKPPMLELAHLNVKHWQSQSDQDYLTHVARVPILTAAGVDDHFELVVGASSAVKLPVGATLSFTEHSGAALGAGRESLNSLQDEMRQVGAEMLTAKPVAGTRVEAADTSVSMMSDLQRIVQDMNDGLDKAFEYMAKWTGDAKPIEVQVFNDFAALSAPEAGATLVMTASSASIISKETAFKEIKRRGLISQDVDWDEEQGRLEAEGPPAGEMASALGGALGGSLGSKT